MKVLKFFSLKVKTEEIAILTLSNTFSVNFLKFLFEYFIMKRTHAQYGYCKKHPKSILFNGDCMECWK